MLKSILYFPCLSRESMSPLWKSVCFPVENATFSEGSHFSSGLLSPGLAPRPKVARTGWTAAVLRWRSDLRSVARRTLEGSQPAGSPLLWGLGFFIRGNQKKGRPTRVVPPPMFLKITKKEEDLHAVLFFSFCPMLLKVAVPLLGVSFLDSPYQKGFC